MNRPAAPAKAKQNGHGESDAVVDIQVELKPGSILIGDVRLMSRLQKYGKQIPLDEMESLFEFLDRVLVGGADQYPVDALPEILQAIFAKVNEKRAPREKNSSRRQRRTRG